MEKRDIKELVAYSDMRATGARGDLFSADGLLVNKKHGRVYACCYRDAPELSIDDFLSAELYGEIAAQEGGGRLHDLLFLAEILLDALRYAPRPSAINRRLKLFCLKNLLFLRSTGPVEHREQYMETLFRFLLFFHPAPEDYLDAFSLKGDQCLYKGGTIRPVEELHALFARLIARREHMAALAPFTEKQLALSRDITLDLLEGLLCPGGPVSFLPVNKGRNLLTWIFSGPGHFFELYQEDRERIFLLLEQHIDHYLVKSWDNDPRLQASIYYGPVKQEAVEGYFNRPARVNRKKKYLVEFFTDMCVFYVLRDPAGLEGLLAYFKDKPAMQRKVMAMLFPHPFYNGEAKLQLIRSGGHERLPEGFWTARLRKMADSL
ncbi:hypothetical protein [Chitinophaga japonensis]|uniref:Uncharacterized protein n=1 Tax=Chitinophaga japonensis TaxID=104662 RepID=A0A562T4N0_CHIJA|nr:hypothetical protein [Chitinophaga japonensis]TWI88194.1 hypothetical protein LX66_2276 [Chitinophaga japonensis]